MRSNATFPGLALHLDAEALRPLIAEVVRETIAQVEAARQRLDAKLAYSEEEAARLLSLEPHVLRDERRRGRITASQIVGRRIRYTQADLIGYLTNRRVEAG